jgi:hypothetical protein
MTETPRSDLSFLSLSTLYNNARRAHPAFKFFTVVAGLAAIVITVTRYGVNSATLVFGIIILIILAVVFLVFVQASALKGKHLTLPAIILVYSALTLVIATATMLFLAAFFNVGLPLRD